MKNETRTTLSCMDGERGFQIKGLNGYILSIGIGGGHYCENYTRRSHEACLPTATMEVAVMRDDAKQGHNAFVALVHDVAGYVPASNLSALIDAVERHDWERVCRLCGEESPNPEKFPAGWSADKAEKGLAKTTFSEQVAEARKAELDYLGKIEE